MADTFLGEIRAFGFNFAPTGWAQCNGQILSISQNTALFSLLGTFYGGNGTSNFALPNLQGNLPVDQGNGAGLSQRDIGEQGGLATVTLVETQIPAHIHAINASPSAATAVSPAGNLPAVTTRPTYAAQPGNNSVVLNAGTLGVTGGSQPHNNVQPSTVVNFCIALTGIYPPRS